DVVYHLEQVADYYPYGKSLREYVADTEEKFLTTHHERDVETGLDYRGARFYDGEVCRFLSVDPLASDFASWSTYSYTFDNPIRFIDPDGRAPDDIVYYNLQGREIHRVKSNTEFRTFIQVGASSANFKDGSNGFNPSGGMFIEAPMPGVASGFEDAKFQQYDHEIAAETAIFNYNLDKAGAGGYVNGAASLPTKGEGYSLGSLPEGNLDVNLVKAMVLEESRAGNFTGGSGTGATDIMQVNNKGDWSELKPQLGLSYGQAMTPQSSVRAGLGLLFLKSMPANDNKVMNFSSWNVWGYNGGGNPNYSAEVQKFLNSMTPATNNSP
ncbi:MAG: RHS repeat-associated core domain-containing protein, partial [Phaeodactylibacter sp.]|nr:RHS repeat-associated core domain-containing protein [Phaeodactylibacter sp.]